MSNRDLDALNIREMLVRAEVAERVNACIAELEKQLADRNAQVLEFGTAISALSIGTGTTEDEKMNAIPAMTDPLGVHWKQPPRDKIILDDTHALMSIETFVTLYDYSRSMPSGVYPGKMWRAFLDDEWWLRWFGIVDGKPDRCSINQRRILLV